MEGMDYRMAHGGPNWGVAVFPSPERSGYPNYYLDTPDIEASSATVS